MVHMAFAPDAAAFRVARSGVAVRLRASLSTAASDRRAWLAVFLLCLPVYLLTAHYGFTSGDTRSSVLPAWQLVHHGNLWVEHLQPRPYWSVPAIHDHLVSNRTPGVEFVNVPMVALLFWLGPSVTPMAITAALMTAATAGFLFLAFRRLATARTALVATGVMAFGTSLWSVASAEVFPHTVDALCLSAAFYALSRQRTALAALAVAAAIPARPHVATVALVLGVGLAWSHRSWRPLFVVGIPATIALAGVVAWNHLLYGHASVGGGYASYVENNLTSTSSSGVRFLATNLAGFLFSPQRGLFVFLPVGLVLLLGVRAAWREAPPWVRLAALGGVAYTLVQLKLNLFDGGRNFYAYRLATELVVCAAPLGVVAVTAWVRKADWRLRLTRSAAAASVGLQAIGAFAFRLLYASPSEPWHRWPVRDALASRPAVALFLLLLTAVVCGWLLQRQPTGLVRRSAPVAHAPGRSLTSTG